MKARILIGWVLFLAGPAFAASGANSREISFMGHEVEPFYFKAGGPGIQGALFEAIQEVCNRGKYHCKFRIGPFRKGLDMLKVGSADMSGPLALTHPRELVYYYSPALFNTGYCFYTNSKKLNTKMTYQDLAGETIGVFGPSATELSLQRINEVVNNKLHIVSEPDFHTTLRKLEAKAYNYVYANCDTGRSWIKRSRSTITEIPDLTERTLYYAVFSKKTFTEAEVNSFNKYIHDMRADGTLEKIVEKYNLQLAPLEK